MRRRRAGLALLVVLALAVTGFCARAVRPPARTAVNRLQDARHVCCGKPSTLCLWFNLRVDRPPPVSFARRCVHLRGPKGIPCAHGVQTLLLHHLLRSPHPF